MERYIRQLLADIAAARENVPEPWWRFVEGDEGEEEAFFPGMDDIDNAPRKSLPELTGLCSEQFPPANRLSEGQLHRLLSALRELLSAFNCHLIFQRAGVPEAVQYEAVRRRFYQDVPQLRTADYFFTLCDPGEELNGCQLGEYCECRFLRDMLRRPGDEESGEVVPGADEFDLHEHYSRRRYGHDSHEARHSYERDEDFLDEEEDSQEEEEGDNW